MKQPMWEDYTLEEMLLHLVVCLDWEDGYPKHEEGTSLARFRNYELNFNDEYNSFGVFRVNDDNSKHEIFYFSVKMYRLIDSVIEARMRGTHFVFWDRDSLEASVLSELDLLQDVLLEITPEGKYITRKER